jgi:hypothetical protein
MWNDHYDEMKREKYVKPNALNDAYHNEHKNTNFKFVDQALNKVKPHFKL